MSDYDRLNDLVAEMKIILDRRKTGAPERAADPVAGAECHVADTPSPENLIALKVAAGRWRRSERSMKKLAADHGALHRVGGRLMVDNERLRAGVFGHVFPLSS